MRIELKGYLRDKREMIESALKASLPNPGGPGAELIRAMNYSLFAGGKRLRPILCIAGAEAVGGKVDDVLTIACALEMIHTYSLIHDDLPSMDDDDMRRGKPTSHKIFGEALAVLAGDGLLTEAFYIMSKTSSADKDGADTILKVISLISEAAGFRGMVGGQAVDIITEGKEVDNNILSFIHTRKTGALISASVLSGAMLGGGSVKQLEAIHSYGNNIGLAFQISDDILDIEGDSGDMGKNIGMDEERGKNTYPRVHGMEKSKELMVESFNEAIRSLDIFDFSAEPLRQIAGYIIERKK